MPLRRALPRAVLLAMSVAGFAGCGGDPCQQLVKGLCDGGDDEYCAAVAGWLETRLVDPATKQPLAQPERHQMCGAIHANVEMFYGYQFKAKQKILGEPHFILASQKKAQEEAKAYEEAMKEIKDEEPGAGGANMSD